ncbi:MAG: c-type cytochrome [Candidatus Kapaibacterium sp.]
MDLFNDLVIPVGSSHLTLIRLMLYISASFLFAYTGLLFGSVLLSSKAARKAKKDNDFRYQKLAQDLIKVGTGITGMWFGLGIVPFLSFILGYPQLLSGTEGDILGYMIVGLLVFSMAIASLYVYKNSLNFKSLFYSFKTNVRSKSESIVDEYNTLDEDVENTGAFTGIWGIILLIVATWFLAGATTYAYDHSLWGQSIFSMLFGLNTIFKTLLILTMGTAFASAVYLFYSFSWQGGYKFATEEERELSKNFVRKKGLYSALLIPLIYAFQIVTIPNNALSGMMFVFGLISLLFVVFFAQSIYLTKSEDHTSGVKYGFMFIMISFAMFAAQDQEAFHTSVAGNLNRISEIHAKSDEARQASYAKSEVEPVVDAQAIFDTRCIACHKFDAKGVGPAYNDVVPKYDGKEGDLVKFILSPSPQNPAEFPGGMPAQGLTPAEGKAMAKWLIGKVLGGDEKEAEPVAEEATAAQK